MKATFLPLACSVAILTATAGASHGAVEPVRQNFDAGIQRFDDNPGGAMSQEEFSKALSQALQMLAANGDQEAFDTIKKAKENGGRLEMSREEAQKFIDRAKQAAGGGGGGGTGGGGESTSDGTGNQVDSKVLLNAIEALAKLGFPDALEAKKIVDKAKETGGKPEIPDTLVRSLLKKAKEQNLLTDPPAGEANNSGGTTTPETPAKEEPKKPDMDKAKEAILALAKDGDKDAKAVVNTMRRNRGQLTLSDDEARKFIERAISKKLIPDPDAAEPAEPKHDPNLLQQVIKRLAEQGDRDAKNIVRKAEKGDGELKYTAEEADKFMEKAKKMGLVK